MKTVKTDHVEIPALGFGTYQLEPADARRMVAAPLATVSIRLDLPPASPPPPGEEQEEPVFISIQDDTSIYVVDEETTLENLIPALNAALAVPNPREERVFVRANAEVTYERFMEVMNTLQANAYYKVGLLNEDIE